MDNCQSLGQRIKELRRARGWSQEELAERMESGAKYLSSLERGRENPTLEMLMKLAKALKVDLVDVFNCSWQNMTAPELKRKLHAMVDRADLERLREVLALMKSREL